MADRREKFKGKRLGFGDIEKSRVLRANRQETQRHEERATNFSKHRNLATDITTHNAETKQQHDKLQKLEEWKKQRELRKKLEQKEKRPAFKVGIYHHPLCPVPSTNTLITRRSCKNEKKDTTQPTKGITKATEKRLAAKAAKLNNSENVLPKSKSVNISTKSINGSTKLTNALVKKITPSSKSLVQSSTRIAASKIKNEGTIKESEETKLNETFEIESKEEEKLDKKTETEKMVENNEKELTTSLIAPVSKTEETTNITTTSSFFITTDRTSTPNTSIDSLSLHVTPSSSDLEKDSSSSKNSNSKSDLTMETITLSNSDASVRNEEQSPVFFSPYVVCSRGKKNARREQELRRGLVHSISEDNIPTKDTVMQNLNISIEDEERTALYFKFLVDRETKRLDELCEKWSQVMQGDEITEDGRYIINQAIGQTRLLLNKKIERFRNLVLECEEGKGERLVTCKDLQGFWDMTHIEIDNCDDRFNKLEELKAKNWIEEQDHKIEQHTELSRRRVTRKAIAPVDKPQKRPRRGGIREHILAAKRKKQEVQGTQNDLLDIVIADEEDKVKSPFDFARKMSTSKHKVGGSSAKDLLKKAVTRVSLSKALKKDSPLTLMKISKMLKTPEVRMDESISYINSNQTPAKSILKKVEEDNNQSRKSMHKVNFNDAVIEKEIPINENVQSQRTLAVVLTRIDSYDYDRDNEYEIRAEKKLNFEESFSCESQSDDQCQPKSFYEEALAEKNYKEPEIRETSSSSPFSSPEKKKCPVIPTTQIIPSASLDHSFVTDVSNTMESTTIRANESNIDQNEQLITRTLRNRTVTASLTPTPRKKTREIQNRDETSENLTVAKEYKSSRKTTRTNVPQSNVTSNGTEAMSPKTPQSNKKIKMTTFINVDKDAEDITEIRRSARKKNVRFNGEECSACTPQKKVRIQGTPLRRNSLRKIVFDDDEDL